MSAPHVAPQGRGASTRAAAGTIVARATGATAEPDYIVVGSGLAGITFAALMAKAGRSVVVLEAYDKPGGYAHTFDVGPYRFNAQLHCVWNVCENRAGRRLRPRRARGAFRARRGPHATRRSPALRENRRRMRGGTAVASRTSHAAASRRRRHNPREVPPCPTS